MLFGDTNNPVLDGGNGCFVCRADTMRKRKVVRFQLLLLVLVMGLLVYRMASGPPAPDGLVVFTEIEPDELRQEAFEIDQTMRVAVDIVGSFTSSEEDGLAAHGWIIRRDSREVVWQMDGKAERDRTSLATAQDTLVLESGTYEVYFAAFGATFSAHRSSNDSFLSRVINTEQPWQSDQSNWKFIITPLGKDGDADYDVEYSDPESIWSQNPGMFWTSGPVQSHESTSYLFEIERPMRVHIHAVGELDGQPNDYGWIEHVTTGRRYWQMAMENTEPAGGVSANRIFQGERVMGPGIYRAVFQTDATHAHHDWRGNPPYDVHAWGMALSASNPSERELITEFDPWEDRTPLMSINEVRDDMYLTTQLDVKRPLRVVVYAVGEIGSNKYDYGWIVNNETGQRVWEMSREASQEAGGDDNNRVEVAFLDLRPGTYTVAYETDGSHAYGDWRNGEPTHPMRWGITLFPLETTLDPEAVAVQEIANPERIAVSLSESRSTSTATATATATASSATGGVSVTATPAAPAPPSEPPPALGSGEAMVQHTRLENDARVESLFTIEETTKVHIYALGEISHSGRYDYGWIERANTRETVWDMTWDNTRTSGSDDKNRLYDGVITLEPGTYRVNFRTDFSHAFNDFGNEGPEHPDRWGITIERVDG